MSGATPKSTPAMKASRSNRSRPRTKKGRNYVTKRELKGGQIHVPSNPPDITYQPWYPATVVHIGSSSDLHITVNDLVKELAAQLDPYHHAFHGNTKDHTVRCLLDSKDVDAPRLNLRLQSVRAWNITGKIISLSIDDFSDISKAISDSDSLVGLVDTGSVTHIPAVGYELPMSHRSIVLRNSTDEGGAQLYHVMAPNTDTFIVYTNVLWRCDGPSKVINGFEDKMISLMKRISSNTKTTNEVLGNGNANRGIAHDVAYIASHLPSKCTISASPGDPDFIDAIRRFDQFTAYLKASKNVESVAGSDISCYEELVKTGAADADQSEFQVDAP